MRINSKSGTQYATFDGSAAGEGLAIFLSQNGDSAVRYRFLVKAMIGEGVYDIGEFYSSPPLSTAIPGRLSRMIAGAVCPGTTSWGVQISAVPDVNNNIPAETAEIILASSRCCTSPIGVSRVSERYQYAAGSTGATDNFLVLAGMKITGISAIGLIGGGTVVIGSDNTITVAEGVGINLAPEASISPNTTILLSDVSWVIEYVESA